jgi:hypothetical protein
VTDRIVLAWDSTDDLMLKTFEEHGERIGSEVLAVEIIPEPGGGGEVLEVDGYSVRLGIKLS